MSSSPAVKSSRATPGLRLKRLHEIEGSSLQPSRGLSAAPDVISHNLSPKRGLRLGLAAMLVLLCAACGSTVRPSVTYKPAFLPVHLTVSSSGISVGGDDSLATPIGTFSIGASYQLLQISGIYVILRDRRTGYDHIYMVRTGGDQFTAVVNGTTSISVSNNRVLIDITSGRIKKITFRRAPTHIPEQRTSTPAIWLAFVGHWDAGWRQSWYKPFAMSRWAYSDTTMGKWFGVGFVWFLIRLAAAVVLALIDTVLTIGFLLGQIAFIVFGATGRDVVYGLLILLTLLGIGAFFAAEL